VHKPVLSLKRRGHRVSFKQSLHLRSSGSWVTAMMTAGDAISLTRLKTQAACKNGAL
jgi:hypothetical protein